MTEITKQDLAQFPWNRIYDVLVEELGASEDDKSNFVQYAPGMLHGFSEYRFYSNGFYTSLNINNKVYESEDLVNLFYIKDYDDWDGYYSSPNQYFYTREKLNVVCRDFLISIGKLP